MEKKRQGLVKKRIKREKKGADFLKLSREKEQKKGVEFYFSREKKRLSLLMGTKKSMLPF